MCFDKNKWMSWACSILFFIASLFYLILGFIFKKEEVQKYNDIKKNDSSSSGINAVRDVQVQQNQGAFKI